MDDLDLIKNALKAATIPDRYVDDLFNHFAELKKDFLLCSYYSSAIGQFVEKMVDIFVYLESGHVGKRPGIDDYLKNLESTSTTLPDSLKIEASRVLRVLYTLRNKRLCHASEVEPCIIDSRCAVSCAQWALAELIRVKAGLSSDKANDAIEWLTSPMGGIIEDFGDFRTVIPDLPVEEELILLLSYYSDWVKPGRLIADMKRTKDSTVRMALSRLYNPKKEVENNRSCYKLTGKGWRRAVNIYVRIMGST